MKFRDIVIQGCALLLLMATARQASSQQPTELRAKVDAVRSNWRAVSVATLQLPENAPVLEALRDLSSKEAHNDVRVPLLRVGDQATVQRCLQELHSERIQERNRAAKQLGLSGNVAIIPLLIGDLQREERPDMIVVGDLSTYPLSISASAIISQIVAGSSTFGDDVRSWASALSPFSAEARESLRAWWSLNKAVIEQGNYRAAVVPPSR